MKKPKITAQAVNNSLVWGGTGARISIYRLSQKKFAYLIYLEGRKRPLNLTTKQFYALEKAFKYWMGYNHDN